MIRKTLLACTIIFSSNPIFSMEDAATKALRLQMKTDPLRKELNAISKQLAAIPKHLIDEKKEKAFKIHQDDISVTLDQIFEHCTTIQSMNKSKSEQSLIEVEKKFNRAKSELTHLKKSIANTLECVKQSRARL